VSLKNFQYDALMRNYNQKQLLQKHQQDERIRRAEEQLPRLREIRREIAGLGLLKARLLLGAQKGDDFDLAEKIQALSLEKAEILRANGYPADYLDLHYDCLKILAISGTKSVPVSGKPLWICCIPSPISGTYWILRTLPIFLLITTLPKSQTLQPALPHWNLPGMPMTKPGT